MPHSLHLSLEACGKLQPATIFRQGWRFSPGLVQHTQKHFSPPSPLAVIGGSFVSRDQQCSLQHLLKSLLAKLKIHQGENLAWTRCLVALQWVSADKLSLIDCHGQFIGDSTTCVKSLWFLNDMSLACSINHVVHLLHCFKSVFNQTHSTGPIHQTQLCCHWHINR